MNRKSWLIGLAVLSVMVAGAVGWLWWAMQRGQTVAKLERSIRDEVPPGCDRRAVATWFERHQVEHWWVEDTTRAGGEGHQTVAQLAGLRDEDLFGTEMGAIEGDEVNVDLMFHGKISLYFFFDKQGRRVGHLVRPFVLML